MTLGAGAAIARLINVMRTRGWVGAEFLAGIPGTIGGAVAMNAGTKQGECKRVLDAVELATPDGIGWVTRSALTIRYRHTELPAGAVLTRARFRLSEGDIEASRAAMDADLGYRKRTQPLDQPNCGSVFQNPPGDHAGRLIESVGLEGRCSAARRSRRCTRTGSSTSARPAPRMWSDSSSARESACARPRASCSCRR